VKKYKLEMDERHAVVDIVWLLIDGQPHIPVLTVGQPYAAGCQLWGKAGCWLYFICGNIQK
jgi:hypothetical protein